MRPRSRRDARPMRRFGLWFGELTCLRVFMGPVCRGLECLLVSERVRCLCCSRNAACACLCAVRRNLNCAVACARLGVHQNILRHTLQQCLTYTEQSVCYTRLRVVRFAVWVHNKQHTRAHPHHAPCTTHNSVCAARDCAQGATVYACRALGPALPRHPHGLCDP